MYLNEQPNRATQPRRNVHVHVHSPSRQDAQPPAPWRHNVEGAEPRRNSLPCSKSQSVSQCSSRSPRAHHTSGTIILGLGKGWGSNSKCTRFALYTRALPLGPVCGLRFRFGRPLDERLGTRTVSRDGSAPLGQHKCTEYSPLARSASGATQFRASCNDVGGVPVNSCAISVTALPILQ